jgi:hypothetical protein
MLIKSIAVRLSSGQESATVTRINADRITKNEMWGMSERLSFDAMSAEEMWQLHGEIGQHLGA